MLQVTIGQGNNAMGWLEWTSSVIGSVAWPIAVVFVALIFRGQISKLLARIKGAKYGDAEVLFREGLDDVEAQVEQLPPPAEPAVTQPDPDVPQLPPVSLDEAGEPIIDTLAQHRYPKSTWEKFAIEQEKFNALAKLSPSSAVLNSWRNLELSLDELYSKSGMARPRGKPVAFAKAMNLFQKGIIDKTTMDIINDLKDLRNAAAHSDVLTITDAYRFDSLARQVILRIKDAASE